MERPLSRFAVTAVVALGGLALAGHASAQKPQSEPPPPAKVSLATVTRRTFRPTVEVIGEARAIRYAQVGSEVDGIVRELDVADGDRLEAGELLVRLDSRLREIGRTQAAAELDVANEQHREYQAGSREEDVREAEAALREAEAKLAEAERDRARVDSLHETDFLSEKERDVATTAEQTARAALAAKRAALDRIQAGPRAEAVARAAADVRAKEAALRLIDEEIDRTRIVAPFPGVVVERHVDVGESVRAGDPLVTLLQVDPIDVYVEVAEQRIDRVRPGASVSIWFDGVPAVTFSGTIAAVVPAANRRARTFPVRIRLENDDHRVLPGMAARAIVPTGGGEELAVPLDAIVRSPEGAVVYTVEDGRARPVPVAVGTKDGTMVAVSGALVEGQPVVVRGNEALFLGREVVIVDDRSGTGAPEGGP